MENVKEFDFSLLSNPDKSRIRVTLNKYNITYDKIYRPNQRREGNAITSKHLLEFIDKTSDTKHYGTMSTIKWFKQLLKGEYK